MPQSNTKKRQLTLQESYQTAKKKTNNLLVGDLQTQRYFNLRVHVICVLDNNMFRPVFVKPKDYEKRKYDGDILIRANEIKEKLRIKYEQKHGTKQTEDEFEYYCYTNRVFLQETMSTVITSDILANLPDILI